MPSNPNLALYPLYEVLAVEGVMHGLYLLWWVQVKHVDAAVVAAILAAGEFAITVLEVPTGWLADRYGHRASLIAGSLTQALGMLAFWRGTGAAGVLEAWGFAAGWLLETFASVGGLLVAIMMAEPPAAVTADADRGPAKTGAAIPRAVIALIAPVACLGGMTAAISFLFQTRGTAGAAVVTAIVAVITLTEAAGSTIAARLP